MVYFVCLARVLVLEKVVEGRVLQVEFRNTLSPLSVGAVRTLWILHILLNSFAPHQGTALGFPFIRV